MMGTVNRLVAAWTVMLAGLVGWVGLAPAAAPGTPAAATPPTPDPTHKPVIYLIGDSTVKNGRDDGSNGQWGWGHLLPYYFDTTKVTVENDAVGGTSSRTFMKTPSMWPRVLEKLQVGDYVIMQFGHNDSTATPQMDTTRWRSTIRGNGEEVVDGILQGGGTEPVHSFGWYMRQYILQTRAKGATPIVCSLIPRNRWTDNKVGRNDTDYALWAKEAAAQEKGPFIPLNTLVADQYDKLGKDKVTAELFPRNEAVHPNWAGAKLNAEMVVAGIKGLDLPLKTFLKADGKAPDTADIPTTAPAGR